MRDGKQTTAECGGLPPITLFTGTKAQFIKLAPVAMELERRGRAYRIIDTGQHAELVRHIIDRFGLRRPDRCLAPGTRGVSTLIGGVRWSLRILGRLLRSSSRLRRELFDDQQGLCLVHGDTVSTLLSTLVARRAGQKVAHVEAGLRSHRLFSPFPEELVRVLVMRMADLLFAPSPEALANLEKMGLGERSHLTPGNTNLDTVALALRRSPEDLPTCPDRYAVASIHRLETLYSRRRLRQVVDFVLEAHSRVPVLFVCHPPTARRLRAAGLDRRLEQAGVLLTPLVDHTSFVHLLRGARFALTDGGSVQEEASYLGTPCLILRSATERDDGLGRNAVLSGWKGDVVREFLDGFQRLRGPDLTSSFDSPSAAIADRIAIEERTRSLVLSSSYGSLNVGDRAIVETMCRQLSGTAGLRVRLLAIDPERARKHYPCSLVHSGVLRGLRATWSAIGRADCLVVGGGGVIQDSSSLLNLPFHLSRVAMARLENTPVVLYGVGVGPVKNPLNRWLCRWLLPLADLITVRDRSSAQELAGLGVPEPRIVVTGDPVVGFSAQRSVPAEPDGGRPFFVVSARPFPRGDLWPSSLTRRLRPDRVRPHDRDLATRLAKLTDAVCDHTGLDARLLSMQPGVDEPLLREIRARSTSNPLLTRDDPVPTPEAVLAAVGDAELVIGQRLHSLILALCAGTPFFALSYDPKVTGFMTECGLERHCADVRTTGLDTLLRRVGIFLSERERIREDLPSIREDLRTRESQSRARLLSFLGVSADSGDPERGKS